MDFAYFLIVLVAIAIDIAFAMYAGGIAEQKGYSKGNWIAVCIIFGIFGYTLIAALPDLELRATLENIEKKLAKDKNDDYLPRNSSSSNSNSNSTMKSLSEMTPLAPLASDSSQEKTVERGGWVCKICDTRNADHDHFCKGCGASK
ncbi:MAG: hypothetical protein MRZ51_00240 [Faecalibacterium sp.]|nr:hypothetical protein [Faecalibacterium sp.]